MIELIYGIRALLESVIRFDSWMKKPLEKAIPSLDHLLSDPAGTLSVEEIEIPSDRWLGSALFMALVASPARRLQPTYYRAEPQCRQVIQLNRG